MGWLFETVQAGLELTEGKNGEYRVKGLFGICGVPTANGRVYPRRLVEREIKRLQDRMANAQVMMECDHPQDGRASLERVAGLITGLHLEGDNVIGEARLTDTPMGAVIRGLIRSGAKIGVSSRGFGSTKSTNEGDEVGEDFVLSTYDFVADPSVRAALPKFYTESTDPPAEEGPLEVFQREFPEAYGQLMEATTRDAVERAKEQTARALDAAVEAERTRVRGEMTEAFERQLRDSLVGVREDLERTLREEYERDPAVGGAKAALAQIVEMVGPYRQEPEQEAVRDALKARALEVATARAQAEQAEGRAGAAERLLALEQRIAGHPLAASLRSVLAPVVAREAVEDLGARVEQLIAESAGMVPEGEVEGLVAERVSLQEEQQKRSQAEKQVESLRAKLAEAVELGQEADRLRAEAEARASKATQDARDRVAEHEAAVVESYKRGAVASMPNQDKVRRLLEAASDEATVDRVIGESRARAMVDGDLERARQAIRARGVAPGSQAFRLEEGASPQGAAGGVDDAVSKTGFTKEQMAVLCGMG